MTEQNKTRQRSQLSQTLRGAALAAGGMAFMAGTAEGQGQGVPDGYSAAADLPNVTSVERLGGGDVQLTLSDGRTLIFQASDVAIVDGYVYLADSAISAADFTVAAAAGGGGGGGAVLGLLGGAGLLGAAAGGGGGGGGSNPPPTPTPNSAPVFTSATTASVAENGSGTVYTATATDADNNTLTYSIVGGADQARFTINSSTGAVTFNASPDFENPADANGDNAYEITIRVSDGTATTDQTVTITVTDENEMPGFTSASAVEVEENVTGVVYTAVATDPEGEDITYSLTGDDAALFTIDAATGEVRFVSSPDFENPQDADGDNVYEIEITASDGTIAEGLPVTITVTNDSQEFSPSITSSAAVTVAEDNDGLDAFATVTATDGDGDALTYSITGGADAALFQIDSATGELSLVGGGDFENPADANADNVYELTVSVSDGFATDSQDMTVTVTDVNEPVAIDLSGPFSVAENSTFVANFDPTDEEGDPIVITLSGPDGALFTIDAVTFELSFIAPPDFETPLDANGDNIYRVRLNVTDGNSTQSTTISVNVTNENEFAPVFVSDSSAQVAENSTGTVYTAMATDGDGDTITYSLAGSGDSGLFSIDATTGEISFNSSPDFENPDDANADNDYEIVVRASDGDSTTQFAVTLTVTDQVESGAPTFDSGLTGTVSENQTSAYVIRATDAEGDTITYSISGTDAALFSVDSETGEVSFNSAPNFESPGDAGNNNVYDITVTASDGTNSNSQDVAITVTDMTSEGSDVPNDNTTQVNMVSGGSYVGNLETAGDEDWIRVELTAGQRYQFDLYGSSAEPVEDTYIRLYDADGNLIAENDDIDLGVDRNSRLGFTASESGVYYIEVDSWDGGSDDERTGEYTLEVSHTDPLRNWSYQEIADYLRSGFGGAQFNASAGDTITVDITGLTADGQFLAREALEIWSDVTGLIFSEVSGSAQITFDDEEEGAFAGPDGVSGGFITTASVNVGTEWLDTYGTTRDTYSFQTYIHEIGHALGLGHAGPYDGSADYGIDNIYLNDSWQATVMSYFSQNENTDIDASTAFVVGLQVADIIAAHDMYGASTTTRAGATTYGYNSNAGNPIYDATNGFSNATTYTIFDAGGIDTMDYSGSSATQRIDLREQAYSNVLGLTGNVGIAVGTVIENAIGGSGSDTLIGNAADNRLTGNGGNDRFFASGGNDVFVGGAGNDTAYFSGASTDYTLSTNGSGNTVVTDNRAGSPDGVVELIGVENIEYDADETFPDFFGDAGPESGAEPLDFSKLPPAGEDDRPVMSGLDGDWFADVRMDHSSDLGVMERGGLITGFNDARGWMEIMESLGDHDELRLGHDHDDDHEGKEHHHTFPHLDEETLKAVRLSKTDGESQVQDELDLSKLDVSLPGFVSLGETAGKADAGVLVQDAHGIGKVELPALAPQGAEETDGVLEGVPAPVEDVWL
jgi:serralysin